MTGTSALADLEQDLAAFPGSASVWCGAPLGPPDYVRLPDLRHYAASTMKIAVLGAAHRAAETSALDLDALVPVTNDFASATPGAPRFGCDPGYDNDPEVWARLGGRVPLRWLAERMIVRSSNLATNIVIAHVGLPAVAAVWAAAGARHSVTARGIEDITARRAGVDNVVTAADLAALLGALAQSTIARPDTCRAVVDVLLDQEYGDDLRAGLPPGTRVAQKDGWVAGVRHSAGIVLPDDAPPYVVVVCTTDPARTGLDSDDESADAPAAQLVTRVAAASWSDRRR